MDQSNFSFIKPYQPSMYEFAARAESYVHSDPQSAMVKLRCFAEAFVGYIYRELQLPTYGAKKLAEKIENTAFVDAVEDCVVDKLTLIRLKGNKAAHPEHPNRVSTADALDLNKEAWFLSAWVFMAFHGGKVSDLPQYIAPKPIADKTNELETALLDKSSALEAALAELATLEQEQEQALTEIGELNEQLNQPRIEQIKSSGQEAVRQFDFESSATREKIRLEDMYAEYELTNGQAELVNQLDGVLSSRTDKVFLLRGYAGTGKTFITKGLTEYFKALRRNYVLSAPTGKAAKVIAAKTQSPAFTLHKTIYSFDDLTAFRVDDIAGTETYKLYSKLAVNELSADTVYIVDESSMISDVYNESEFFRCGSGHLLKDFLKFVNLDHNDHGKKIILIGDDAQLPPVGMPFSPALDAQYLAREYGLQTSEYELTEVVRQKGGSGVMKNAITMRNALKAKVFNKLDIDLSLPDVAHVEHADLVSRYLQSCDGKINAKSIVIAHSNADVAAYNRRIREEFFPGKPNEVSAKDKLMVINNSDHFGFFISNGDFGQVMQVYGEPELRHVPVRRKSEETGKVEELTIPLQFRDVRVRFRDIEGDIREFDAKIIETLLYSDYPALSSDQNKALYIDFCIRYPGLKRNSLEFKETLRSDPYFNALRVKFGYAITCHKAQGSEWENVFVKCKTHQNQMCADYFRWLYTAITRTSKQLYLLDEPHIRIGSGATVISSPGIDFAPNNTRQKPVETTLEPEAQKTPDYSSVPNGLAAAPNFGIPDTNIFLNGLLSLVRGLFSASGIEISDIEHHQYNEGYHLVRGSDSGRINIIYNSQCKLTSISAATDNPMTNDAQQLLAPLVGRLIANTQADNSKQWSFDDEFLNELHQGIESALSGADISVAGIKEQNFSQRYTFQRASDVAVIDIYYNKKKQVTKYSPLKNMSSSHDLLTETLHFLSEGLGNG